MRARPVAFMNIETVGHYYVPLITFYTVFGRFVRIVF
jgi:hypothetical protein